jgi:glycosyltransferase involved in cell wall biosynthesis
MRILHVYSGNLYGGIEVILYALAQARAATGQALGAAAAEHAFALCFEGRLSGELQRAGAELHVLGEVRASRPQTLRRARARLNEVLAVGRFDRVICHAPWSQGLFGAVVRRAGVPLVFWAHDVMTGRHWTERLARLVTPDTAICNSAFTASTLRSLYAGVPSRVIYAPVVDAPKLAPEARARVRASFDTEDSAVVVVTACRSEAWKGHEVLIAALAELRDVPRWIWWQAGGAQRSSESTWLDSIRGLAQSSGIGDRTRWLGQRDDVQQLLQAADIYCQPNLEPEPFGVVFVEALRAGLPVVTSALGGAPEIVDETCGALTAPGDTHGVAAALRQLIVDDGARRRKGVQGPARAAAIADPSTQIQRLERALAEMSAAGVRA